jgi:hypothetical protein
MATSVFSTFTEAVISKFKASSDLTGVRIFDGIEIDYSYPGDAIAVGHDGNMDTDEVYPGTFRQEYKQLGAISKFEDGTLKCFLWSSNGIADITARRERALAILAGAEKAVRADVSFGGVVMYSGIESSEFIYRQTTLGAGVGIIFTITYRAKI